MYDTTLNGTSTDLGTTPRDTLTGWRATYTRHHVPVESHTDRKRCFAYECPRRIAEAGAALCRTHRKRYLEVIS